MRPRLEVWTLAPEGRGRGQVRFGRGHVDVVVGDEEGQLGRGGVWKLLMEGLGERRLEGVVGIHRGIR